MAANDYHVIVYQILAYLYSCLKDGVDVDLASIERFKDENIINEKYWQYILRHLAECGYVEGLQVVSLLGGKSGVKCTSEFIITPLGIEYLLENSLMQKAKDLLLGAAKATAGSILGRILS